MRRKFIDGNSMRGKFFLAQWVFCTLLFIWCGTVAGDNPARYRFWKLYIRVLGAEKLMTLQAKLVSYDGIREVRTVTAKGEHYSFLYQRCSRKDRQYLDSLDAPVDYAAPNLEHPVSYWYDPPTSAQPRKWAEGRFHDGRKTALWRRWWENGRLKSQGEYQNGLKTGRWEYWNEDGRLVNTEVFNNTAVPPDTSLTDSTANRLGRGMP